MSKISSTRSKLDTKYVPPLECETVIVENTSKELKLQLFLSVWLFWFGLGTAYLYINDDSDQIIFRVAFLSAAIGGVTYIATKIRIWWHHG